MRGTITIDKAGTVPNGQSIRLRILDTSRVDADAVVIMEDQVPIPEGFDAQTDDLTFDIEVENTRPGLTIQAHLAQHDGEDFRKGDMITTAAIPVPMDKNETVVIPLQFI